MGFFQDPPRLGHAYREDPILADWLARRLPHDMLRELSPALDELGAEAVVLHEAQLADRENEPRHTPWDAWGNRVDRIELTPLWQRARVLAAERGLVALAYERRHGEHSRVHQFALNYLVQASLDVYSCPLAMTDGAARTLLDSKNAALIARAVPRLTARDPLAMWTSGQWMTERTGGSDVGLTETVARPAHDPAWPGAYRLTGTKWFTSATTSEMALTLARPEGNGPGGRGLALFYVETRREDGGLAPGLVVNRLKDKLGTRKVPTAELALDGVLAHPVAGLDDGVRNISSMLNVTRTWNAAGATWGMRRAVALAKDYARRRVQFGASLAQKPLHVETLAGLEAEAEGAFCLTFRVIELLGRIEAGIATDEERVLFRLLTPIAKLTTGKQAVAVASEALECFGGAGYVEDTGLPLLLRDSQVLSIWEGTTNVLALDVLRVVLKEPGALAAFEAEVGRALASADDASLVAPVAAVRSALAHARAFAGAASASAAPARLEAGARGFALTLGRALEAALLAEHASECLALGRGPRAAAAARRLARNGLDLIAQTDPADAELLLG